MRTTGWIMYTVYESPAIARVGKVPAAGTAIGYRAVRYDHTAEQEDPDSIDKKKSRATFFYPEGLVIVIKNIQISLQFIPDRTGYCLPTRGGISRSRYTCGTEADDTTDTGMSGPDSLSRACGTGTPKSCISGTLP
jgi:hypothetical protein